MATLHLTSNAFNELNRIAGSTDLAGSLLGFRLDNQAALTAFGQLPRDGWTAETLTDTAVVLTQTGTDGIVYRLSATGSGIGPVTSAAALLAAVGDGTATGLLSTLSIDAGPTRILSATPTATGLSLVSGAQTLDIDGTIPLGLGTLALVGKITGLLDDDVIAGLGPQERAGMIAELTPLSLASLTLRNDGAVAASIALSTTGAAIVIGPIAATIVGTPPANLGALAQALFDQADAGRTGILALLPVVNASALTVSLGGSEIARADGDLTTLAGLSLTIEGRPVPEGTPLIFDLAGRDVTRTGTDEASVIAGSIGNDALTGGARGDTILGGDGNDRLLGMGGDDFIYGGDGIDTLNGGDGHDQLFGGTTAADLRDVIFGGDGNDTIDGGHGNDELHGGNGDDLIIGGFGSDSIYGNDGNDTINGGPLSDLIFGGPGNDFINGGFGHDRVNGGTGADIFYHLGIFDHGSDWIQDYRATEGDTLRFGQAGATRAQFQVNIANTAAAGLADVAEAFVIYRPTGQIIWALVDGAGQSSILLTLGSETVDLLA